MTILTIKVPTDIERLVTWALRDQGLGWDKPARGSSLDRMASLGTMISGGVVANPSAGLLSDEDALQVRLVIDMLKADARALVVQFGRAGLRPEGWDETLGEPEQLRDKRGRPRWEYAVPGNKRSAKRPMLDMLSWTVKRDEIAFARAQWTAWREALIVIRDYVQPNLQHHIATGPEAPAEPWLLAKPVVYGSSEVEPSTEPQPWLKPDKPTRRVDRTQTAEDLRRDAQADVRAVATDWGAPKQAIRRRRPRQRRALAAE